MDLPIYQLAHFGNTLIEAVFTVVFVTATHGIAIGLVFVAVIAGLMSSVTAEKQPETSAKWSAYAATLTTWATHVVVGVGFIAAAGIAFTSHAFAPATTSMISRTLFWVLFGGWLLLVAATVLLMRYQRSGRNHDPLHHIIGGGSYLAAAVLALAAFTVVSSFTLTPGSWPFSQTTANAVMNPGFFPQLSLRLAASITFGGILAACVLLVMRRLDADFRHHALLVPGLVTLIGLPLTVAAGWWQFSVIPVSLRTHAVYAAFAAQHEAVFLWTNVGCGAVLLVAALLMLKGSVGTLRVLVLPMVVIVLAYTAEYERMREFIRGPYLVPGYSYTNDILLIEHAYLSRHGLTEGSFWFTASSQEKNLMSTGAFVFGKNCASCHTVGGMNDILKRVDGRSEDGLFVMLNHLNDMAPFMPPFTGTSQERRTLARYLALLSSGEAAPAGGRYLPAAGEETR